MRWHYRTWHLWSIHNFFGRKAMSKVPVLKVVIVGDANVGKTSLLRRYCEGKFESSRVATIGVDFQTKVVDLPEGQVKLSIWDMAGQEHFSVIRTGFYRGSLVTALVFDVTDEDSFNHLETWQQEVAGSVSEQDFVVVGNKIDLERTVNSGAPKAFADNLAAPYIETSALTGEGVEDMFIEIAQRAFAKISKS
jgi:small GTP-binding protein